MLIAIDASRLVTTQQPTGVEVYCQAIIRELLKKSNSLILYTPELLPTLPQANQKILSWPFKRFWSQVRLGLELLIHPPDIFFSPGYVIPFLALFNKKTKKIVTIHDVAFIYLPHSYSIFQRWFLKLTTRQAVKYAHKIIVPTQTTKNDLIKHFNCLAEKIEVTYFGISFNPFRSGEADGGSASWASNTGFFDFVPANWNFAQDKFFKQILYIGRIEDKKNIINLIQGFRIFHQKYPDYKLVLAGKPGTGFQSIKASISRHKFIDYRGYIDVKEKAYLLQTSSALVLLSKYEGFGFPLLEAFSYQLPVLASDIQVLREIGQSACLFVQPDNLLEIAKNLESIIINKELRQQLIQAGQRRLKFFNWQKCAEQTRQILNS